MSAQPRAQTPAQARSRRHLRLQPRVSRQRRGRPRRSAARDGRIEGAARRRLAAWDSSMAASTPTHEVFAGIRIHHHGCDGSVVPSPHGTAVAHLLVSRNAVGEIFAADVYCGEAAGGAVDAVSAAFGWMARERVAVINVSLVGPRNKLHGARGEDVGGRGHLIVAAVGNDGPAAPPLYPASYDGVIGVTAVDGETSRAHRSLPRQTSRLRGAGRGHPGGCRRAEYLRARARHFVRGADHRDDVRHGSGNTRSACRRRPRSRSGKACANDLGKPGRDDIYGDGRTGRRARPVLGNTHK